jgi:hypothetical protein
MKKEFQKHCLGYNLKHTSGPWKVCPCGCKTQVIGELDKYICDTQNEANARLIASAPEMLEILVDLYKLDFMNNPEKRATALFVKTLIEKATGLKIEDILK